MARRTIPLCASAASYVEVDILDGADDSDEPWRATLAAAWTGRGIAVTPETRGAVADALTDASNAADELSRERSVSDDERAVYRRASLGLSTAMGRARAAFALLPVTGRKEKAT